jgi:hypothetical protein
MGTKLAAQARQQLLVTLGGSMKRSIALMFLSALVLAGCGRTIERETVVERPVVRETIIERPAAVGVTSPSCVYASQAYSHGALSCQDRTEFKCENGMWRRTFTAC